VHEIIIVDWGSREPIRSVLLQHYLLDPRIQVISVEPPVPWSISRAINLAADFASGELLLKLDSDTELMPGFFEHHQLPSKAFYAGNFRRARNENEKHLNGVFFWLSFCIIISLSFSMIPVMFCSSYLAGVLH
jgi:dolichol kinase